MRSFILSYIKIQGLEQKYLILNTQVKDLTQSVQLLRKDKNNIIGAKIKEMF